MTGIVMQIHSSAPNLNSCVSVFPKILALLGILFVQAISIPAQANETISTNPANSLQASVETLGQLNGIALACNQMALSMRLRDILINEAPKARNIGEWFEQASQQSFLTQGKENKPCPNSRALANDIDAANQSFRRQLLTPSS